MNNFPFLDLLCCPACRGDLVHEGESLHCNACKFTFPIVDGIPVLFPCNVAAQMDKLFGRYWDSPQRAELYHEVLETRDDIFNTHNLQGEIDGVIDYWDPAKLNVVLDAGCGNGRFLEMLPPDSIKVGLDASLNLLRITKQNGRGDLLVCGELEHLPFRDGVMDTVYSCRVIQHLRKQQQAVGELARVTRDQGDMILELYNNWNLKTIYKNIRMDPRLRKAFNAPFRALFRSMSPFEDWGIAYDRYNNWFQVKQWMRKAGFQGFRGRGIGFGWHKYLWDPLYVNSVLQKRAPGLLSAYYRASGGFERVVSGLPMIKQTMEKFTICGTKNVTGRTLIEKVARKTRSLVKSSSLNNLAARNEQKRETSPDSQAVRDNRFHLVEAVNWLKRAQDATPDGGVARGYCVGWVPYLNMKGWQPSYPETTGYIIPTFFNAANMLDDGDLRKRALRMADWEIEIQMHSGAVMGGVVNENPSPAVFNTGQVMLGWLRAFQETSQDRYITAADKAAVFLMDAQSPDGAWRKGNSQFAAQLVPTYNARCGWALILYGQQVNQSDYVEAGRRNMRYVISQQQENGWFRNNCLSDESAPLVHTISYAVEGLLGAYDALGDAQYLDAAKATVDHLAKVVPADGNLPGRFDGQWQPTVSWSCLTGDAQLAAILLRLATITGDSSYQATAQNLIRFLKATQNCVTDHEGLRGGIKGSYPFDGEYGRYEVLNWPTKFFVDALLIDQE